MNHHARTAILATALAIVPASAAQARHLVCVDGKASVPRRMSPLAHPPGTVCDADQQADGTCTFAFRTGLLCAECPQMEVVTVPLDGRRVARKRVAVHGLHGTLICRRAP